MERSFAKEVQALKKGDGEIFEGEGILAVTKAALQAGVSYVGGYQGSPVSHLVDVLSDAKDIMDEYGVHLEICANEAGACSKAIETMSSILFFMDFIFKRLPLSQLTAPSLPMILVSLAWGKKMTWFSWARATSSASGASTAGTATPSSTRPPPMPISTSSQSSSPMAV